MPPTHCGFLELSKCIQVRFLTIIKTIRRLIVRTPSQAHPISAMPCFKSAFDCQPVILVLTCGLGLLLLRQICMALYRLFFHPLSGFPGPSFAAMTSMYKTYYEVFKGGELLQKIHRLHSVYGEYITLYEAPDMLICQPFPLDRPCHSYWSKRGKYRPYISHFILLSTSLASLQ